MTMTTTTTTKTTAANMNGRAAAFCRTKYLALYLRESFAQTEAADFLGLTTTLPEEARGRADTMSPVGVTAGWPQSTTIALLGLPSAGNRIAAVMCLGKMVLILG